VLTAVFNPTAWEASWGASVLGLPTERTTSARWAAVAFVASYSSPRTRQAYTTHLRLWFDWCSMHDLEPLTDVRHPHVERYARALEARGLAAATVALKLVVLTGFYRYCVEEQLLEHSPAVQGPHCARRAGETHG
jgi:site-specific recombinase XerD